MNLAETQSRDTVTTSTYIASAIGEEPRQRRGKVQGGLDGRRNRGSNRSGVRQGAKNKVV